MTEPDFDLCRVVGESVDRLLSVQVFSSGGGALFTSRNVTQELYQAARDAQREPLSYLAARALIERVRPRDVVIIACGFLSVPTMVCETDGPIGAAHLARALCIALNATPVILTEVDTMPRVGALLAASGLEVAPLELARAAPFKAAIVALPIDPARAKEMAGRVFEQANPAAMISIEKPSPNRTGTYHTGAGIDVTDLQGKVDHFLAESKRRNVLTIGIGDGGNEVGMGLIADVVRASLPTGETIASSITTDILVASAIANWGSYGIEATLAAALHMPEVIHSLADERRVSDASVRAGLIDPVSGLATGWVDGTPPSCSEAILELLRQIVVLRLDRRRPEALANFRQRFAESNFTPDNIDLWARRLAAEEQAYFTAGTVRTDKGD